MPDFSVLFVDDEPLTRRVSLRLIGRRYPVLEADSGVSAMACLEQQGDNVGVVITDMKMDKMDGMSLIKRLYVEYPNISIIASTGDLSNYEFSKLIDEGKIFSALEKPWNFDAALATIDAAMQAYIKNVQ